jgi:hypothetical protein
MVENLGKWPLKRGPIYKIRPSDGCGKNAVHLAVLRWYDFHEYGSRLGNAGQNNLLAAKVPGWRSGKKRWQPDNASPRARPR